MTPASLLPPGVRVFERGWLSSNNILVTGADATLIDTGYCSHADQTLALVTQALGPERALDRVINTHLHSDHCGANALLQSRFPQLHTAIPPGHADAVAHWDAATLSYEATGQQCPRYGFDSTLPHRTGGVDIDIGGRAWIVHPAPGHDPHSIILFEPEYGVLISADALWQNGFGVVFPELEGESGFAEVGQTLDLIGSLAPRVVIPGHGAVFTDLPGALAAARRRLSSFTTDPVRHAAHGCKVLLKFKLLELQRVPVDDFVTWAAGSRQFVGLQRQHYPHIALDEMVRLQLEGLARSGAVRLDDGWVSNVG